MLSKLRFALPADDERGVVHRDLKPANVLLAEDGTPKITDFGLARKLDEAGQTASGSVLGTPSYMAPEQAGGSKDVGPPADVWALGAILYECLTGRPPFKAATALDTLMQVLADEPVPPSQLTPKLPRDLENICLKCLQKEPHKRYATALGLGEDLAAYLEGRPTVARPATRMERLGKWVRRRPAAGACRQPAYQRAVFSEPGGQSRPGLAPGGRRCAARPATAGSTQLRALGRAGAEPRAAHLFHGWLGLPVHRVLRGRPAAGCSCRPAPLRLGHIGPLQTSAALESGTVPLAGLLAHRAEPPWPLGRQVSRRA
jgi:hypothetical protein